MKNLLRRLASPALTLLISMVLLLVGDSVARACPFCSVPSLTLAE